MNRYQTLTDEALFKVLENATDLKDEAFKELVSECLFRLFYCGEALDDDVI